MFTIQKLYLKLLYPAFTQYVYQNFMLNIADNNHYACFPSLKLSALLHLVMNLC